MTPELRIPLLDLVIIIAYLAMVLIVGVLSSRRKHITSSFYFLAGRSLGWGVIGAALFASNISTIHLVGLAASGYNEGLVWGNFEWLAIITLILLSLVFAPFYFRTRIATLPEYLERRYSSACRSVLAFMAILGALFIHIGMSLYAGAEVFRQFFGIDVITSIAVVSVIVSIYTVLGGLRAVVVTETIQSAILLVGAAVVTVYAILALPEHGIHSFQEFRAAVRPNQLNMLQTASTAGVNWYAVFLGYPVLGIWYWCTDQTIVQRVLGARTERDAQLGPLFAGLLKTLPVFVLVLPGVIGYVLFRDIIGEDANQTLPVLINQLVPTGLKGLISAAVLAALMSTIAAALNSSGTLVAMDIVKRLRPSLTDDAQVRVARVSAVVVMLLAMLWSTQGGRFSSIFEAANIIAADLAPPIATVFLFGVFWRRGTKEAAVWTLVLGFLIGAACFALELPAFGEVKLISQTLGVGFMMQAWWSFCLCSAFYVSLSLLTPPPRPESVEGLTWPHPMAAILYGRLAGISDPRTLAGLLLAGLVLLYLMIH